MDNCYSYGSVTEVLWIGIHNSKKGHEMERLHEAHIVNLPLYQVYNAAAWTSP